MKTQPEQPIRWYAAKAGNNHQGLVIEEGTSRNVAVTYDVKDAPLAAAAPEMADMLRKLADATQNARRWIVLSDDEGLAAYNETAEAVMNARDLLNRISNP